MVNERVLRPQSLAQLFARYDFARTLKERLQYLEGLSSKFDPLSAFTHFP
jgi:hypothetical protein